MISVFKLAHKMLSIYLIKTAFVNGCIHYFTKAM